MLIFYHHFKLSGQINFTYPNIMQNSKDKAVQITEVSLYNFEGKPQSMHWQPAIIVMDICFTHVFDSSKADTAIDAYSVNLHALHVWVSSPKLAMSFRVKSQFYLTWSNFKGHSEMSCTEYFPLS